MEEDFDYVWMEESEEEEVKEAPRPGTAPQNPQSYSRSARMIPFLKSSRRLGVTVTIFKVYIFMKHLFIHTKKKLATGGFPMILSEVDVFSTMFWLSGGPGRSIHSSGRTGTISQLSSGTSMGHATSLQHVGGTGEPAKVEMRSLSSLFFSFFFVKT